MKGITLFLSFLSVLFLVGSFSPSEAYSKEMKVLSLWQSADSPEGLENVAMIRDQDNEYGGDHLLFFGKKSGAFKVRHFHLSTLNLYLNTGSRFEAFDEYHFIRGTVLRAQKILKLKFLKENDVVEYEATYNRILAKDFADSVTYALEILNLRLSELDQMHNFNSMSQFKRALFRLKDHMGFVLQDDENYGLPVHELQTEQEWSYTMPQEKIRKTNITDNGTDYVSKNFRHANEWTDEADVPRKGKGVYSFFREEARAFGKQVIKEGSRQFLKYEVVNVHFIKCNGLFERVQNWTWVLKDGSIFSYTPTIDCE